MAEVECLPDAALDGDIAVLGRKGGGKTFTSKGIVERLLDLKRRVLILDPLGVWAGLRTSADGERPGYQVAIFGGQHGDEPLEPALAVPLAQVIAGENLPAILDLSELTKTAQGTFLYRFLHELRRVNRDALTVVLEEADVFAPQNPQGDDSKLLHGEIDWISRRGRFRGFRLISITQRPARLSKDVLTQCATLIAHKLPAPQDRDAVKAWVEGNGDRDLAREVFDTLAGLQVGEAWVWSPEHDILQRMKFPRIKTLDTSATPKAGESRIEPKTLAEVDMSGIRKALAEAKAAKDAEQGKATKPSNPGEKIDMPDPKAIADAEARGFEGGRKIGFGEGWKAAIDRLSVSFATEVEAARHDGPSAGAPVIDTRPPTPVKGDRFSGTASDFEPARKPARAPRTPADPNAAPPSAGKLLAALARMSGDRVRWEDVCLVAGMLHGNGYFYAGKRHLIDAGMALDDGDTTGITRDGLKGAGGKGASVTRAEILGIWRGRVKPHAAAMLDAIARAAGEWIATKQLAAATGIKPGNGHWYSGISSIRDPGLVEQDGDRFRLSGFMRGLR